MKKAGFRCNSLYIFLLCFASTLVVFAAGCGSSTSTSGNGSKPIASISVTPAKATLAVAATQQFTASATYSDGTTADVTPSVSWSSSSASTATISSAGVATAVAAGSTTITATLSGISGTGSLTVTATAPKVQSIAITPANPGIAAGATQQLTATATYSDGSSGNVSSTVTWTSASTGVATVSAAGVVTGVSAGSAVISAAINGVTATDTVTVTAAARTLSAIAVTPASGTIGIGASQQLTATANYSDGTTANVTSTVTWTSSNTAVATVSPAGLATGVAAGSATITAALQGVSGTAALTVATTTPTLVGIVTTPASASVAAGATQQFTATASYSDGSTSSVTSTATWTTASTKVATVNTAGLLTGVAAGTTTVTATLNGAQGTASITVTARTPTSIAITPSAPSFSAGSTQQFTATATYSDGSTAVITSSATWASTNTSVATINAAGLASGVSSGSASITATDAGVTGTTTLMVTARSPKSIAVTPNPSTFDVGSTQQFTATATYSDGTTSNVTSSASWSVANTSVATINGSGLATGVAAGSTTVTAAVSGVTANASITVSTPSTSGINVTTWHYDPNRSGLDANEQSLTPSNVNSSMFGKLFSYQVDGYVYGSPLIMSNLTVKGAKHDVVFVATEADSVYAFDADSYGTGAPLWQVSLLAPGESTLTGADIGPVLGVTSTPVIDPGTGTMYVVSAQKNSSGGTFKLHALDITTGAEKFGGPVTINASVAASNSASVNGVQTLTTSCIQRAALLLANGNVYMGFGGCHSGWLLAYNASNLSQVGVFNSSTVLNGEGTYASAGGVWMGGGGPVADASGNVYIVTGNGPWNGTNAFADSVLKFGPKPQAGANGSMQPIDYFTPDNYQFMDCNDADLAAGGLLLIPGTTTLVAGGKTGTIYLPDSNSMGHEKANDSGTNELVWGQGLPGGNSYSASCQDSSGNNTAQITSYEIFGTSAYYNNYVYLGVAPTNSSAPGGVRQFEYSGGMLTPAAQSAPSVQQGTRGTSPVISANGNSNGIVWMIDEGNPIQGTNGAAPSSAILRAYNADQFPTELYNSSTNSGDAPGYGIKFTSPVVANGKVYITTAHDLNSTANPKGEVDVYGLK